MDGGIQSPGDKLIAAKRRRFVRAPLQRWFAKLPAYDGLL
jgi:hypothetical protein